MEEKKYSNGEVTITWRPKICTHSTKCWRGENSLPEVFNPSEKPWIKPEGASTERIIEQVNRCPSGAISFTMNHDIESGETEKGEVLSSEVIAETLPNGPLLIYGNIIVKDQDGNQTQKNKVTAFCRCGASGNKPFCDGAHTKVNFVG